LTFSEFGFGEERAVIEPMGMEIVNGVVVKECGMRLGRWNDESKRRGEKNYDKEENQCVFPS
jgi:hypothetical protein